MATNKFFNNFNNQSEQRLLQDLIVEAIQIYGHDIIYIPRNITNYDKLYQTDDQSTYSITIPVEIYIQSIDGFDSGPMSNIFTKFALEIRDSLTVTMARRTFERIIQPVTSQPRPNEGALIYFTMNKKCFVIRFVNNKEIFYPLGDLPTYQMNLQLFDYSDETFNTGIEEIDSLQKNLSLNILDNVVTTENNQILTNSNGEILTTENYDPQNIDIVADSDILRTSDVGLIDRTLPNPFGEIDEDT